MEVTEGCCRRRSIQLRMQSRSTTTSTPPKAPAWARTSPSGRLHCAWMFPGRAVARYATSTCGAKTVLAILRDLELTDRTLNPNGKDVPPARRDQLQVSYDVVQRWLTVPQLAFCRFGPLHGAGLGEFPVGQRLLQSTDRPRLPRTAWKQILSVSASALKRPTSW